MDHNATRLPPQKTRRPLPHCCYKGCNTSVSDTKITLFKFPQDPARRSRWLDFVDKADRTQPYGQLHMCDLHFSRNYLSINPRRKRLIGEAIPSGTLPKEHIFVVEPLVNADKDTAYSPKVNDDNFSLIDGGDESDADDGTVVPPNDSDLVEYENASIIIDGDLSNNECLPENDGDNVDADNNDEYLEETDVNDETPSSSIEKIKVEKVTRKRQFDEAIAESTTPMKNRCKPKINKKTHKLRSSPLEPIHKSADDESTTLRPEITQFIFNGMEYVQMPKSIYMADVGKLKAELDVYKRVITTFKQQLSLLENVNANE